MLSTLQDAESLFGVGQKEKVVLRIPGKCAGYFELKQFDPNFLSEGEILCRYPECCKINLQAQGSGNRRELYLCPTHVDRLNTVFSQAIKGGPVTDKNFSLSMEDHDQKDLTEFTSLIGLLEVVYHAKEKSPEILEAILNARNFLIITSTVLQPIIAGPTAVPLVALMLRLILENKNDTGKVNCLVSGLHKVIEVNLGAFGIVYSWISKSTIGSERFAKGGIDVVVKGACLLGFLLGLFALSVGYYKWKVPVVSTYWKEIAVGGGLVSVYECCSGNSGSSENGDLSSRRIDMYYFQGDADGGLEVSVFTQDQ
ncbi:unnamed protein product [Porites lobata]|uniref:Uncharacterized protein n=1 Tax=Porites lobata TaxID=104759 RepID=A0ABN8PC30_9CNID|nr:unnamed protein product [Porites lobata]